MKVTFEIFYTTTPKPTVNLFNARSTYTLANFGNVASTSIEIKDVSADYIQKYGAIGGVAQMRYGVFLADCFKYNFRITAIDGYKCNINPFKDVWITSLEEVTIEFEEVGEVAETKTNWPKIAAIAWALVWATAITTISAIIACLLFCYTLCIHHYFTEKQANQAKQILIEKQRQK